MGGKFASELKSPQ